MSSDNLTGEQIQQVMDMLLYKALEPIILYTNAFDPQVEYLLMLLAANGKRKLSSLGRDVVVESLAAYLVHTDRKKKFELIRSARIERFFVHSFIKRFVDDNSAFIKQYVDFIQAPNNVKRTNLDNRAVIIGGCKRSDFYNAVRISSAYISQFYAYRETIIGHYLKHSSKQAKAYAQGHGNTDFMDLRQSILKAVITALDKYDSRKGALTSYINFWIFNAATSSTEHEYGIAYTIPQTQKKKLFDGQSSEVNFSVSLDSLTKNSDDDETSSVLHSTLTEDNQLDNDMEQMESSRIVQALSKFVDKKGVARLCLDIGEYFSKAELQQMRNQMRKEGLL